MSKKIESLTKEIDMDIDNFMDTLDAADKDGIDSPTVVIEAVESFNRETGIETINYNYGLGYVAQPETTDKGTVESLEDKIAEVKKRFDISSKDYGRFSESSRYLWGLLNGLDMAKDIVKNHTQNIESK